MTTNLRQRKQELDEVEFLDENEQKELIAQMHKQNERWSSIFKSIIMGLAFLGGATKLYFALTQFAYPFTLSNHSDYYGYLSTGTIVLLEWASSFAFACIGISAHPAVMRGYTRQWLHLLSLGVSLPVFLLLCIFYPSFWVSNFVLMGANVLITAVCYYVNFTIASTKNEINKLKQHTYSFRKI